MTKRLLFSTLAALLIAGAAFAHGGHKHVTGTVATVDATSIAVKTAKETVSVPLSSATHYFHGAGTDHAAAAADVKAGMRVVVHEGADGAAVEVHIP